jgi:hypothetical protein
MNKKYTIWLLGALIITMSCRYVIGSGSLKKNNMYHENTRKYYYEMDTKSQKTFLKKINEIKYGDSLLAVKAILGEPNYDEKLVDKMGKFKARVLKYYIKIFEKNLVNEKYDRSVRFVFDSQDRLIEIESNLEGFNYNHK